MTPTDFGVFMGMMYNWTGNQSEAGIENIQWYGTNIFCYPMVQHIHCTI